MKVRYFAWMKRTVGVPDEEVAPPAEVKTVGDLVVWLRGRSAGHAEALAEGAAFGAAVDQRTATSTPRSPARARSRSSRPSRVADHDRARPGSRFRHRRRARPR